ncbi:MAG: hypothetical protein QF596_09620 [Acidimicrobiales bacterium]|jgi:hypothetical protein|nr:hypothetical protein [Acidimicrobiales bacterium]MDP6298465.1 hypothetical protein [Acidimicrobiales bacterium]HJM28065.1 hypothetical protein [Acidimicrobiales bacterium]HJM97175.1 hypothetical protein [Acidimicrobiales bacterium]
MVLWFIGLAFIIVASVFESPLIDYRLIIVGSTIPVLEMIFSGPWILHSLAAPVTVMAFVMLIFMGKRLRQRRWLGLPIGMFLYLFLDRAWTKTSLFWWPISGITIKKSELPSWESPLALVLMEAVGAMAIIYSIKKYKLFERENLKLFLITGHIQRKTMKTGN